MEEEEKSKELSEEDK